MRITSVIGQATALPPSHQWESGITSFDRALGGGMAGGRVHEIYAAEVEDSASAAGFTLALTTAMNRQGRSLLWLRTKNALHTGGVMQGHGWMEMGVSADAMLLGTMSDSLSLLRVATEALRCPALGAVIVESHGAMRELDLTASRRLALAAEKSGVTAFLLRSGASPCPSVAQTRWQVTSAPSQALPGYAPGKPVFDVELLRQRAGPSGLSWRLEWNRDERSFRDAAHDGAVVPVPAHRQGADRGTGTVHPIIRHAA